MKGEFTLSTGRVIRAHRGVLGVDQTSKALYVGYNDVLEEEPDPDIDLPVPRLTAEERREVAEFMIKRWNEWAA